MTDQKAADAGGKSAAPTKESRRHDRRPCREETHFLTRQRLHEGVIRNVSKGGTYIETDDFFFAGQEVTVAGPFEDGGGEGKQKGAIVRFDGKGIGIKFVKPGS
jgi:hypothetical protein